MVATPEATSTGTIDSTARVIERSRTSRKMNTRPAASQVSSVRLASRFSRSPTPTTARPDGVSRMPGGVGVLSRRSWTTLARSSSEPGLVR